jgi:hypothetical protein
MIDEFMGLSVNPSNSGVKLRGVSRCGISESCYTLVKSTWAIPEPKASNGARSTLLVCPR